MKLCNFFLDVVADIFPETADDEDEDDEFPLDPLDPKDEANSSNLFKSSTGSHGCGFNTIGVTSVGT